MNKSERGYWRCHWLGGFSQQPAPIVRHATEAILHCADPVEPLEAGAVAARVTSDKTSRTA